MSRSNKLPFAQGKTAFGSEATSVDNLTRLQQLVGQTAYLPDIDSTGDKKTRRSNADVVAVIVRNVEPNVDGSTTLAAGDAVQWVTGYHGSRVEKADSGPNTQVAGFVDEHSSGVKTNDLFYMVVKGPSLVNVKDGGIHGGTGGFGGGASANYYKEGFFAVLSSVSGAVEGDITTAGDGSAATGIASTVGRFKQNAYIDVLHNATLKALLEVAIV